MTARVGPPETQLAGSAPPMTRPLAPQRDQSFAPVDIHHADWLLQQFSTHASINFFTPSSQAALSTVFRTMEVTTCL